MHRQYLYLLLSFVAFHKYKSIKLLQSGKTKYGRITKQKKIFLASTAVQKDDFLIYFFISKEMGNGEVKCTIYVTALINYINRRKLESVTTLSLMLGPYFNLHEPSIPQAASSSLRRYNVEKLNFGVLNSGIG